MIAWNFQRIVGTCQFRVPWFGYPCGYSSLTNDLPDSAILRNDNGKWYAVFMNLEGFKIGLDTKDRVDIMVVKCKPDMISVMTHMKGFLPGYYMDKSNWMTILLQQRIL